MSLFPDEDILTREIESWRGFIEKLPTEYDKIVITKLLNDCYKYSVEMNSQAQTHPFPSESMIMAILLTQHKIINQLRLIVLSKREENDLERQLKLKLKLKLGTNFYRIQSG